MFKCLGSSDQCKRSNTLIIFCILAAITFSACYSNHQKQEVRAQSPQALKNLFERWLKEVNQEGQQEKIRQQITHTLLNADQAQTLLQESPSTQGLGEFYQGQMASLAQKELVWAISECAHQGYQEVEVSRVGPQAGSSNAHGDLALLEQLKKKTGLYTVRLKRNASDSQAFRLSAWLYLEGQGWVTLLKLGEEIERRKQK